jgi:hypothetical protein
VSSIFRTDFPFDNPFIDRWEEVREEWLTRGDSSLSYLVPFPMNPAKQLRDQPKYLVWNVAGANTADGIAKVKSTRRNNYIKRKGISDWGGSGIFDRQKLTDDIKKRFPLTVSLFRQLPPIVTTAGFMTMEAGCQIMPHQGANVGILRTHVCIDIPAGDKCRLMVQDTKDPSIIHTKIQKNGDVYCFDDAPLHWAGNATDKERTILMFDFIDEHWKAAAAGVHPHVF